MCYSLYDFFFSFRFYLSNEGSAVRRSRSLIERNNKAEPLKLKKPTDWTSAEGNEQQHKQRKKKKKKLETGESFPPNRIQNF